MERVESNELKPGDVVVLKVGGPRMTIERIDDDPTRAPMAHCVWFEGATLHRGYFMASSLMNGSYEALAMVTCGHCGTPNNQRDLAPHGGPNEWRLRCCRCGLSSIFVGPRAS